MKQHHFVNYLWYGLYKTTQYSKHQAATNTYLQCRNTHSLYITTKVFQLNVMFKKHLLCSLLNNEHRMITTTQPHHNRLRPFFRDPPRWASARRELLDFMVQGKTNRGRHTNHPARRHFIRTNHPPIFYRLDALPAAQPTVSNHWRHRMITVETTSHQERHSTGSAAHTFCWLLLPHVHLSAVQYTVTQKNLIHFYTGTQRNPFEAKVTYYKKLKFT